MSTAELVTVADEQMVIGKMYRTKYPGIFRRRLATRLPNGKPKVVYVVVWRDRAGKQHKQTHPTLKAALQAQGGRRDPTERNAPANDRFDEYARTWIKGHNGRRGSGFTERSRAMYSTALETHAIPYFGRTRLAEIEPPDIRAFIRELESKSLKPATVAAYLKPVRALFATAVEDRKLKHNPTTGAYVNRKSGDDDLEEDDVKAMTREELKRVLDRLPEERRLFFEFLVETGLRVSEALGVEVRDVKLMDIGAHVDVERQFDREGRLSRLKTKASRRKVPLSRSMVGKLRLLCETGRDRDPLFRTLTGERIGYYAWRESLYTASGRTAMKTEGRGGVPNAKSRDHAGVPWISFHTFRHTCASILFSSGKNIKQVAAWLGHADAGFTLRTYVHLMDEGIGDASCMETKFVATERQRATPELPHVAVVQSALKAPVSSGNAV